MKKFRFRFEAVEKVRELEREMQIKQVALANQEVERIESEIQGLEERLQQEVNRLNSGDNGFLANESMRALSSNFRREMRRQIQVKKQELLEARTEVIRERRKLVERQKKKKAMEVLREKEQERYYEEQSKIEAMELDEISGNYFSYRNRK